MQRRGDGAETPTGAVQEKRGSTVGELPGHDVAASDPRRRQPARQIGDGGLDRGGIEVPVAIDHGRSGAGAHRVGAGAPK
jgi:hypothetical protein